MTDELEAALYSPGSGIIMTNSGIATVTFQPNG
jgi:hypothetical protein